MKKLALILLAACSLSALGATVPIATRAWVLEQIRAATGRHVPQATVTTNAATGGVTYESAYTDADLPGCVSVRFTMVPQTNHAIRLSSSTIPGVAVPEVYAWDYANDRFVNATNTALRFVYADATNRNGRAAAHYRATASDGTVYTTVSTNHVLWLVAETNASWHATITPIRVDATKAARLVGGTATAWQRRYSFAALLTVYAGDPPGGAPSGGGLKAGFAIGSGSWTDKNGNVHEFSFDAPVNFGWMGELPEMPDTAHVCGPFDANCNCEGYGKSTSDFPIPPELQPPSDDQLADPYNWVSDADWRASGGTYDAHDRPIIKSSDGSSALLSQIWKSDAVVQALQEQFSAMSDYYNKVHDAYLQSKVCDQENPQHLWNEESCGGHTWKVCGRNPSHKQGTEAHGGWYDAGSVHRCVCGKKTEGHALGGWSQIYKDTTTRVFQRSCSVCRHIENAVHTHSWKDCEPCTGTLPTGETCGYACGYCNGEHKFEGTPCHKCSCPGCTVVPEDMSYHTGWHACSANDDDNDDGTANGAHCACACGAYGHSHGTDHFWQADYYRDIKDNDDQHFLQKDCKRCGYVKKKYQNHRFKSEPSKYVYGDDDVCYWVYECEDCGHEKKVEHEHEHEEEDFEDTGDDSTHLKWYKCTKCGHSHVKSEEEGHDYPDDPSSYVGGGDVCEWHYVCTDCGHEKVEDHEHDPAEEGYEDMGDGVCRHWYKCVKCGQSHVEYEDGEHVRGDHCVCVNCGSQLEHSYTGPDACGNMICEYCGDYEEEVHIDYGTTFDDYAHYCACGLTSYAHTWSGWEEVERTDTQVKYRRHCTTDPCGAEEFKFEDNPEKDPTNSEDKDDSSEEQPVPYCPHGRHGSPQGHGDQACACSSLVDISLCPFCNYGGGGDDDEHQHGEGHTEDQIVSTTTETEERMLNETPELYRRQVVRKVHHVTKYDENDQIVSEWDYTETEYGDWELVPSSNPTGDDEEVNPMK